jgi:hypothetical protein
MRKKKIIVPEKGLNAAVDASTKAQVDEISEAQIKAILEAFLRWQRENPPVQKAMQLRELLGDGWSDSTCEGTMTWETLALLLPEWVRRMYDAPPEPQLGLDVKAVKDLLWDGTAIDVENRSGKRHDEHILEAYRRGRESK